MIILVENLVGILQKGKLWNDHVWDNMRYNEKFTDDWGISRKMLHFYQLNFDIQSLKHLSRYQITTSSNLQTSSTVYVQ